MADIIREYAGECMKLGDGKDRYIWDERESIVGRGKYGYATMHLYL